MKRILLLVSLAALVIAGCKTLETISEVGTTLGVATGRMTQQEAESINRSASAVGKTFDSLTPEQEYYIGRTVAAVLLNDNKPYDDRRANDYLNVVGQYLALCSDRPETFGGYHFLIMDTDDINAFAAPGGLILVSRGMLRCCRSEDALAAVLAHEIGHIQHKHGLQAISKSRIANALTVLASESAKTLGGQDLAELTKTFEASISDITSTLVNSGYSRRFESQADAAAVTILRRAGYDPKALIDMLTQMDARLKPDGRGFAKTHPSPKDRIEEARKLTQSDAAQPASPRRQARFEKAIQGV